MVNFTTTMTFEEFFTKKRIDLTALQQGDPRLFSEFKLHFEQMGEKSFDHTKKYWFNSLRKDYHLAPGIKVEKPKMENQLAEQTIADELSQISTPAPKVGFTPRFKGATTPSAEPTPKELPDSTQATAEDKPKVGFTLALKLVQPNLPTFCPKRKRRSPCRGSTKGWLYAKI
ncbi:hypothetical protein [Mucilaginibacter antarcticus]|uniref:hypothetical protein n=1 Tax=Mucilaginibacter antarcticus TaxID=1855725 RepID=UPI0036277444